MTEALLFDFNGVITDDEEQHRAAFAALLAETGIPLSREQYYADYLGCDDRSAFVQAFQRAANRSPPVRSRRSSLASRASTRGLSAPRRRSCPAPPSSCGPPRRGSGLGSHPARNARRSSRLSPGRG